jgi:hypothetical protein
MKIPEQPVSDARLMDEVSEVLRAEADVMFTDERLARQRAHILRRIEEDTRPGQVIAFPNAQPARQAPRARPGMRWIAGAAAAGLLIGAAAGHLAHDLPGGIRAVPSPAVASRGLQPTLQAVSTTMSEEEFLGQLEIAIETTGGSALRPLDDLTPLVWEVAAQ